MAITTRNLIEILIQARDEASATLDKVGSSAAGLDRKLVLVSAAMAATGAAILTAVDAAAIAGARYADSVEAIAARTQTSRETITALGVTLSKTGGQFEDSEQAIRAFSQAQTNAIGGQKEAIAQFQRLGISVDDLVGANGKLKNFDELLPKVADGFKGLGDEALATDSAVALFGRGATAFIPVLLRGADGFKEAQKEAAAFNVLLGGPLQNQAAQFGASLDELKLGTTGLNNSLAGALNPTLGETVRNLTAAAKAAGQFTQEHPQLVSNIVATTGALTALAAAPAAIKAVSTGFKFLHLELIGASVAASGFGKSLGLISEVAGPTANGLELMRVSTLGVAAGLGAIVTGVAVGIAVLGELSRQANNAALANDQFGAATRAADATLKSGTASIEEQVRALDQLRQARIVAAAPGRVSLGGVLGAESDIILNIVGPNRDKARADAAKEFDSTVDEVRKDLIAKSVSKEGVVIAGIQISPKIAIGEIKGPDPGVIQKQVADWYNTVLKPQVEQVGPTVEAAKTLVKIDVDTTPVDPRDFKAQIARQQKLLSSAAEETAKAQLEVKNAGTDPVALVKPTEDLNTALKAEAEIRQRITDLQRQAETASKDLTRAVRDNEQALLSLAVAGDKITIDQAIVRSSRAVDTYRAELDAANKAVAAATPGTVEYTKAIELQSQAIRSLETAQQGLSSNVQIDQARQQEQIDTSNAMTAALKQLTRAREDLAITEGKGGPDKKQRELDAAALARLQREAQEAQAGIQAKIAGGIAANAAGLPAFKVNPEDITRASDAMNAYSTALLQAQQATDHLNAAQTIAQGIGNAFSSIFTSIGQGAAQMAKAVGRAILSIITDMLRAIITAKIFKALIGVGAAPLTGGASIATLGIAGFQSGGRVVSGIRGSDTQTVAVGQGEAIFSDDLSDQLSQFLAAQKKTASVSRQAISQPQVAQGIAAQRESDQAARQFVGSSRSTERVIERVTNESSPEQTRAFDRLAAAVSRITGTTSRSAREKAPEIHLHQDTTINTGVRFGTEIEDQRAASELNDRSSRYLRGFIAKPGFAG